MTPAHFTTDFPNDRHLDIPVDVRVVMLTYSCVLILYSYNRRDGNIWFLNHIHWFPSSRLFEEQSSGTELFAFRGAASDFSLFVVDLMMCRPSSGGFPVRLWMLSGPPALLAQQFAARCHRAAQTQACSDQLRTSTVGETVNAHAQVHLQTGS